MKLILCVDDRGGMLFGGRRLSRDRAVCQHILNMAGGAALWMNAYSQKLFSEFEGNLCVYSGDPDQVAADAFLFAEDLDIEDLLCKADALILYRWNRVYPSDVVLPLPLSEAKWKLVTAEDFPGNSHEKITCEVYIHEEVS